MTNSKQFFIICLPMVNCSFCKKELKRNIFCSASCKVRFHRGDKTKTAEAKKQIIQKPDTKLCQHGNIPDLCKYSKCRGN